MIDLTPAQAAPRIASLLSARESRALDFKRVSGKMVGKALEAAVSRYNQFVGSLETQVLTQARRFETRLREQGADAGFAIQAHVRGRPGEILDRAAARQVEQSVRFLYGIPEHRSHRETLPQLARPVPWPEIQERSAGWMERLGERFDVLRELVRITDHSIIQPLPSVPRRSTVPGRHHGTWLGAKGQNLIYREGARSDRLDVGGRLVALKASDVVGRIVETAP